MFVAGFVLDSDAAAHLPNVLTLVKPGFAFRVFSGVLLNIGLQDKRIQEMLSSSQDIISRWPFPQLGNVVESTLWQVEIRNFHYRI
ncbi:MAG: hypothetical protein U5R48_02885 [Gammaproteobacteria bacterium]|nr:hypothetical protein [Gammaproteobacteria bacterium]